MIGQVRRDGQRQQGSPEEIHGLPTTRSLLKGLTEREKALIALAVAHAVQCPYCIDAYTQASLEKGSNIEEMTEAVHVACAIRGGASLAHGVQMRNVADKLSM